MKFGLGTLSSRGKRKENSADPDRLSDEQDALTESLAIFRFVAGDDAFNDRVFSPRRSPACANRARCISLSTWESRVDGSRRPTRRAA